MLFTCSSWQDLLTPDDDVPLPQCLFATAHSSQSALVTAPHVVNVHVEVQDLLGTENKVSLSVVVRHRSDRLRYTDYGPHALQVQQLAGSAYN